jgi:class 3 adenylate cyclase/tetratricopeptide (TPR) repeat protein
MTCPSCARDTPDGARFCPNCGAPVTLPAQPRQEMRKTVTVVFCDMTDSTALSGRLDAESLRELMLRYYTLMRDCLERHGGTVEKFIGDAVVAVFGVPVLHEDDALRALRAAVEMTEAIEELNRELRPRIGEQVGIRIGVNTGEVVAAEDAGNGQVLSSGEAVNVAARLQGHAAPGEILIGPVTRVLAGDAAVVTGVGKLTLKGIAVPVPAWRLSALRQPPAVPFRDRDDLFVGRSAELARLTEALDEARRSSRCQVVLVYGEAGIGKSRLAEAFAAACGQSVVAGAGRCQAYGEGSTLHVLTEALRRLAAAARHDGLLRGGMDPDLRDALAWLRDGAPGELPDQFAWAATTVLRAIGRNRPAVLFLDDLHTARPVLFEVLRAIAGRVGDAAVLIVGLGRPELAEGLPGDIALLPHWPLPLGPLPGSDAVRLVASLLDTTAHHAGLVEQIAERGGGNPFFLEQLVGVIDQGNGGDTLPPTIRTVVAARLDLLDPVSQDALLRAAVLGPRFSVLELSALLRAEPALAEKPQTVLATLARQRLIVAERAGGGYRFTTALIRDVAYHTLSKRARVLYHEVLARWHRMRLSGPDLIGAHLEQAWLLSMELGSGGAQGDLRSDAAATVTKAGLLALRRGDLHWAADLLERALRLHGAEPGRLATGVHLAETRMLLGVDPDARPALQELADRAARVGEARVAAHARLLLAAFELPGADAAAEALASVPVFAAADDQLGLARAWLRAGQLRQLAGQYGQAEDLLRRALSHALAIDSHLEIATAVGGLAASLWRGPVPAQTAMAGCRALLVEHSGGRRAVRATVNCPLAALLAGQGEFAGARELVRHSERIIGELGHASGASAVSVFAALVEGLAGEWARAEALLREAARASAVRGDALTATAAAAGLARALLEQGSDPLISDCPPQLCGDPYVDADLCGVTARARARLGDADGARGDADLARAIAAGTDSAECQATAELDRAHVLRQLGDLAGAEAAGAESARLYAVKGHLVGVRRAAAFAGQAGAS